MVRKTIFFKIVSTLALAVGALLEVIAELCPSETLEYILVNGMDKCSNQYKVNEFCTGRHSCENLGKYQFINSVQDSEDIYRYCCEKFGVCVCSTESYVFSYDATNPLNECKEAMQESRAIPWGLKRICCKRGLACDLEVIQPRNWPDRPLTWESTCHHWEEGTCVPNTVDLYTCYNFFGKCNVTGFCSPNYWEENKDTFMVCFHPEPIICLHPANFGLCCDTFNMCEIPICGTTSKTAV